MKVALVYPPQKNSTKIMLLESIENKMGYKPPLSIMYLGAYLRKAGHSVYLVDAQAKKMSTEQTALEINRIKPDLVGITAYTDYWYDVQDLIKKIKKASPDTHVSVGGPHVLVFPQETLDYSMADSIAIGDGEEPLRKLAENIENKIREDVRGVYLKGQIVSDRTPYEMPNLNELPFPARDMLPLEDYSSVLGKNTFVTTMMTTRGCPFQCTFCKLYQQKTRVRSAENVVKEFVEIKGMGINEVEVYDDTFSVSKKRVIEICQEIIDRKLDICWAVRDRVDTVTEETLEYMKKAGCERIHFGIESGSDETLKLIKKGFTTDQARYAVEAAKNAGLEVLTYFMIGLPGETKDDVIRTIEFAIELDSDYATFSVTVPYPDTELYKNALRYGIIPIDFWSEYVKRPTPNFLIPYFHEENLNKKELNDLRDLAIRRFYFRPKHIIKNIKRAGSISEIIRKARMALSLRKETK
jgi:radical SAM superfamily enzyme YgiQ (UPF0313 family)